MAASLKLIERSLILKDIYKECDPILFKVDNIVLLNYLCELSKDNLLIFIKCQNIYELVKLFNMCDFLNIPFFLKYIGIEIANRMNKMSKKSIRESFISSDCSFKRIL